MAMMEIMAEEIRSRKRELLRQAESISIALDDRGEYRLVRFRCDCPLGSAAGNGQSLVAYPKQARTISAAYL